MSHVISKGVHRIPRWIKRTFAVLFIILLLLLVWGVLIEPRIVDVETERAEIAALPPEWQGQRIAVFGDLQVGMWFANTDTIRKVVSRTIELRPAAVLITGDFIFHPLDDEPEDVREDFDPREFEVEVVEEIRTVIDLLRPLAASGIPTYAVLGNHDYAMESKKARAVPWLAQRVRTSLEGIGIRVLHNQAVPLPSPSAKAGEGSTPLYLVGIGAHYPNEDNPAAALAEVPTGAPRLVLMHNPDTFPKLPAGSAPLAFAGHTHGGQVRVPFTPEWSMMSLLTEDEVNIDGWIPNYGSAGNRLYVNRGIGFSLAPVRINCLPELTVVELRAAP